MNSDDSGKSVSKADSVYLSEIQMEEGSFVLHTMYC